ncbi:hypothetical protein [Paenibacillus glucanolyticus]|nr:hypothetical protein [Paenibacillus glucanolyticus]
MNFAFVALQQHFRNGGGAAEIAVDDKDVGLGSGYAGFGVGEQVVEA